jgi:excinuclease UvrABC nuclease subunit
MLRRRLKRGRTGEKENVIAGDEPDDLTISAADAVGHDYPITEGADDLGAEMEATEDSSLSDHNSNQVPVTEKNDPGGWTARPDLLLLDGGKGQLSAVVAVLAELGIPDQPVAGIAKQHEEIFLPGRPQSILLPPGSQALFLVQRIRDEAHRFANTYHQSLRGKRSLESSLDQVPGIGARRKKDLLRNFGTVSAIRRASLEEVAAVPGIGLKTATAIKDHLGESA